MESNRIEYKREVTDSLEKEVIAFLNYHDGGIIYIGIDKSGNTFGVNGADALQLAIKDRIKNNIQPSALGLFDVVLENRDQKNIIKIIVASGSEKPYSLRKYGMTEKGCFIRIGSAAEPMPQNMINSLYSRRIRNTIGNIASPRKNLTFEQLFIYYETRGLKLNEAFLKNLELLTPEGEPNYAAYLLADENSASLLVAKYSGKDRVNLIENRDFGRCCLVKALKSVLERVTVENTVYTQIGYPLRKEREMIDSVAIREAIINAVVHNDYSFGATCKIEFFSDRVEITSMGGLPYGVEEEDFFSGFSVPRNKELMRIFRDLEIVEQLGSGIPRIIKAYGRDAFEIRKSFLRVTMIYTKPFELVEPEKEVAPALETKLAEGWVDGWVKGWVDRLPGGLIENQKKMLFLIGENPNISKRELSEAIGINSSAIDKSIVSLKKKGILLRVGSKTEGYWQVLSPFKENDKSIVSSEGNGGLVEGWVDGWANGWVNGWVDGLVENQKKMLFLIEKKPNISKREMSEAIGINTSAIDKSIVSLKKKGILRRVGSKTKGYWQIMPPNDANAKPKGNLAKKEGVSD